jgi:hypothetical protein
VNASVSERLKPLFPPSIKLSTVNVAGSKPMVTVGKLEKKSKKKEVALVLPATLKLGIAAAEAAIELPTLNANAKKHFKNLIDQPFRIENKQP